jgi:restriction system protein
MSRTNAELASELLHAVLQILSDSGGRLPSKDVINKAGEVVKPTPEESVVYPHSGNIRWKSVLHLQSIGFVKAGFIQKRKGIWYLTEEGEKARSFSPKELRKEMMKRYMDWKANQPDETQENSDEFPESSDSEPSSKGTLSPSFATEEVEALALKGIEDAVRALDPYQFQDLVAALLRGMGYHTPFISPKGKDGGIDVIAYKDPLGTQAPTIFCQVKHRPDAAAGIADVQRLMGSLQHGKNVGLFVTSGTFSSDARVAARNSHVHLELVDLTRFIELWIEHYPALDEDDRGFLRLKTIHVAAI